VGWFGDCEKWFHEGSCKNDTDREMRICVDGNERTLAPGESTPRGVDCDGILFKDGSVDKIWGRSGWKTRKSPEWVREHWPGCAQYVEDVNAAIDGHQQWVRAPSGVAHINYMVHCEDLGDSVAVPDGWFIGTKGQARRLEGFCINAVTPGLRLEYMAHLQNVADTPWASSGQFIGTRGQALRLEGFAIRVAEGADRYGVAYSAHLQDFGDSPWFTDGQFCGTRGQSRRVEGLRIFIVSAPARMIASLPVSQSPIDILDGIEPAS
jgi:hypothetical protein